MCAVDLVMRSSQRQQNVILDMCALAKKAGERNIAHALTGVHADAQCDQLPVGHTHGEGHTQHLDGKADHASCALCRVMGLVHSLEAFSVRCQDAGCHLQADDRKQQA